MKHKMKKVKMVEITLLTAKYKYEAFVLFVKGFIFMQFVPCLTLLSLIVSNLKLHGHFNSEWKE